MSSGWFSESVFASVCQSHSCTLCLQYLPDRVGDLADTETAGGLWWLPSIVPPHVPLHLWHKLEGLSHFGPVLWLLWPHRIKSVHVSGQCATPSNNRIKSVSDQFLHVHTSDMQHVKKLRRATGPDFVSLNPLPVQSSSARAVVSLRDHKHTVKLALSRRTLICSCIRKTKKTHMLNRLTGCRSHLSPYNCTLWPEKLWLRRRSRWRTDMTWTRTLWEREGLWAETWGDLQLDWS